MSDNHRMTIVNAPIEVAHGRATHPLVAAAMANGSALADPATLRELLAVQREWEAGEARKAYTRALTALKRDLPTVIARDKTVAFGDTRYTHTSLAAVMDAVTDPLTAHGFSLAWIPATGEKGVVRVTCRLTHSEGHFEEASLDAPSDKGGRKSDAQAVASTITLLSRYTALALLGIATADMPEDTGQREPSPTDVDPVKNLRAAKWLADRGLRERAEARAGRPVSEWTEADRGEIKAWAETLPKATPVDRSAGEVAPEDEP